MSVRLYGLEFVRVLRVQITHRCLYVAVTHELGHHLYRNARLTKTSSEGMANVIKKETTRCPLFVRHLAKPRLFYRVTCKEDFLTMNTSEI